LARKRRRKNRVFVGVGFGLIAAMVAYVLIAAGIQTTTSPYHFHDLWIPRAVDCLIFVWLFWVGSAIGSFLNVVAWRMPRGQSINGFSHCPRCNQKISARDNWPVFGWIALRGRCRVCRLPISPRYPLVELAVGLTLTFIGLVEIYAGQWNLPYRGFSWARSGPMSMPIVNREILGLAGYHVAAVASSWALGLVRFDDQKLPRNLVSFVFAITILPMLLWEPAMIVPWKTSVSDRLPSWTFLNAIVRVTTGLVAAALIARSLARYVCPTADLKLDPLGRGTKRLVDLVILLAVPSIVVGWQAALGVVIIASLIARWCMGRWGDRSFDAIHQANQNERVVRDGLAWFAVSLPVALTLQIVFWRWLEQSTYWPSSQSPPWVILVATGLALVVPVVLRPARVISNSVGSASVNDVENRTPITTTPDKDSEAILPLEESD
jgi:leader peptidase (prepilin peptidase) / N-methyltransferase